MRAFIIWSSIITFIICLLIAKYARGETASWYSEESCRKESGQYVMANGEYLNDNAFSCASWDFALGTRLLITNKRNRKQVSVTVTDRGPRKELYKKGRTTDLSKAAFSMLDGLEQGVIPIKIEVLK